MEKQTNKHIMLLGYLILSVSLFLCPLQCFAVTSITSTGIAGSGFPVALTTAGETYLLTEDISCDTTCFTLKAANVILNLNGRTATFGTANNPGMTNTGMETWSDVNTLTGWTVLSGTVTRVAATQWGDYDAQLSATASIKSPTVTLNSGQTYTYYAMIGGTSADSYVISVNSVADDSVLATTTISGDILNRAFAMGGGTINAAENNYKPSSNVNAYLKITCVGTSTKRMHVADIKPDHHFFMASNSYRHPVTFPDLPDNLFGGTRTNGTITNGTITQGAGNAVKSGAVQSEIAINMNNLTINMTGNNTAGATIGSGGFTVDTVTFNTSSILNFNRMHSPGSLDVGSSATGTSEIKNSTFNNDPEYGIRYLYTFLLDTDTHVMNIHDNIIRNKEQVTEGYGIVLSGVGTTNIYNNTLQPVQGRGILIDSVANRTGYLDGTKNVTVRNNSILGLHEYANPEYGVTGLEAAGIRIRNWGGNAAPIEGHRNLKVYENTITGYVDATTTHRTYGINITASANADSIEIYNNSINIELRGQSTSDWQTAAIALQNAGIASGGTISIHNNVLTAYYGLRFGGNDGNAAKGLRIFENDITGTSAPIFYYAYAGDYANNLLYCNKLTNSSTSGFNVLFDDTATPTMATQYFSNNLFTNANSSGYEIYLVNNYSTSIISCGNGTLDITGGGSIGTASSPCHDGTTGGWASAGLTVNNPVPTPPAAPKKLIRTL